MLLAIDIGNTNISFGLFRGEQLLRTWSLSTDLRRTADEYEIQIDNWFQRAGHTPLEVDAVVIGNVVPPLQPHFERVVRHLDDAMAARGERFDALCASRLEVEL